jgi:hypothetical protein
MIVFTAMIVKAKTAIMAMTIKPYESIAYTEIAPRTHLFPDSIDTNGSRHAERSDKARSVDRESKLLPDCRAKEQASVRMSVEVP